MAALTDHDTTAGFGAFSGAALQHGILAIPGCEIAAVDEGEEVHLLALFASMPGGAFAQLLFRLSAERQSRAAEMLDRLEAMGIILADREEILSHAQVGRPHIARSLVRAGHARDTAGAFARFLSSGGPAYVDRYRPPAPEAIALAHNAGGIVSLAHPRKYRLQHIGALAAAGLDAVEAMHPSASSSERQALRRAARAQGLLVSGGSDFHGAAGAAPGDAALGRADALRLLTRLGVHTEGL